MKSLQKRVKIPLGSKDFRNWTWINNWCKYKAYLQFLNGSFLIKRKKLEYHKFQPPLSLLRLLLQSYIFPLPPPLFLYIASGVAFQRNWFILPLCLKTCTGFHACRKRSKPVVMTHKNTAWSGFCTYLSSLTLFPRLLGCSSHTVLLWIFGACQPLCYLLFA